MPQENSVIRGLSFENSYRHLSKEYVTYGPAQLTDYIIIPKDANFFEPKYLKLGFVKSNTNTKKKSFLKLLKSRLSGLTLTMSIDANIILNVPLDLFADLSTLVIVDCWVGINLHFDKLFGRIELVCLKENEIKFNIVDNYLKKSFEPLTTWELVGDLTYVDSLERGFILTNSLEDFTLQFSHMEVNVNNENPGQTSSEFKITLPFNGPHVGLFIKCKNPDEINTIKLYGNNIVRFSLDRFLIKTMCKRISQSILWFPFNSNADFLSKNMETFEGQVNFSNLDIKLEIIFNSKFQTNKISIFALGINVYKQFSGTGASIVAKLTEISGCPYYTVSDLQTDYQIQIIKIIKLFKLKGFELILDKSFCPISFGNISTGTQYTTCTTCKNNYCVNMIINWFDKKSPTDRTCPICKTAWTNWESFINDVKPNNMRIYKLQQQTNINNPEIVV